MDIRNGAEFIEPGNLTNNSANGDRMSVSSTEKQATLTYQEKVARARLFQEEEQRKKIDEYERNIRKIEEARSKVNSDRQRKIDEIKRRDMEHRRKVAERRLENEKANIDRVTRLMEKSRERNLRPGSNLMLASCYVPGSQANKVNANRDPSSQPNGFFMTMGREDKKMTAAKIARQEAFEERIKRYMSSRHRGCFLTHDSPYRFYEEQKERKRLNDEKRLGNRANSSHSLNRANSRTHTPRNNDKTRQESTNLTRAHSAMSFAQPTKAFLNRMNAKVSSSSSTSNSNRIPEKRRSLDDEGGFKKPLRPPIPAKKPSPRPQPVKLQPPSLKSQPIPKRDSLNSTVKLKETEKRDAKSDPNKLPIEDQRKVEVRRDSNYDNENTKNNHNSTQSAISEIKSEDSFFIDNKSENISLAKEETNEDQPIQSTTPPVIDKEENDGKETEPDALLEEERPDTIKPIVPKRNHEKPSSDVRKESLMTTSMIKFQSEVTGSGEGGDLSEEDKRLYREKMAEVRRLAREKKAEEEQRAKAKREEEERIRAQERAELQAKAKAAQEELIRKQEEELRRIESERQEREEREKREREERENRERKEKEERDLREKEERKKKLADIMSRVKTKNSISKNTDPFSEQRPINGFTTTNNNNISTEVDEDTQNTLNSNQTLENGTQEEDNSRQVQQILPQNNNSNHDNTNGTNGEINPKLSINYNNNSFVEKENNNLIENSDDSSVAVTKTKFQHPLLKAMQTQGKFNAKSAVDVLKKNLENNRNSISDASQPPPSSIINNDNNNNNNNNNDDS